MRVLCFTATLRNGGVQNFLINYASELRKQGIYLDFVVQGKKEEVNESEVRAFGCKIFHVSNLAENVLLYISDVWRLLKSHKEYKVVWAHLNFASLPSLLVSSIRGIPVRICHSHSCYSASSFISKVLRFVFFCLIKIISTHRWACSKKSALWLFNNYDDVKIIPNAIDPKQYRFSYRTRIKTRQSLGVEENDLMLLSVGTLSEIKNQLFLVRLMKQIVATRNNVQLVLCGDGSMRKELEYEINSLGLSECVILLGSVNRPDIYMCAADILLVPSKVEGLSLVVIESQFVNLPSIISNAIPDDAVFSNLVFRCNSFETNEWIKAIETVEHLPVDRQQNITRGLDRYDVRVASNELAVIFHTF